MNIHKDIVKDKNLQNYICNAYSEYIRWQEKLEDRPSFPYAKNNGFSANHAAESSYLKDHDDLKKVLDDLSGLGVITYKPMMSEKQRLKHYADQRGKAYVGSFTEEGLEIAKFLYTYGCPRSSGLSFSTFPSFLRITKWTYFWSGIAAIAAIVIAAHINNYSPLLKDSNLLLQNNSGEVNNEEVQSNKGSAEGVVSGSEAADDTDSKEKQSYEDNRSKPIDRVQDTDKE